MAKVKTKDIVLTVVAIVVVLVAIPWAIAAVIGGRLELAFAIAVSVGLILWRLCRFLLRL